MLDYSMIQVVNSNSEFFPISGIWLLLILFVGIVYGIYIFKGSNNGFCGFVYGTLLMFALTTLGIFLEHASTYL